MCGSASGRVADLWRDTSSRQGTAESVACLGTFPRQCALSCAFTNGLQEPMTIGIIGKKTGMTRVFRPDGRSVPVTVVTADPNRVTKVKTAESDSYVAVQVTRGKAEIKRLPRPAAGQFENSGVVPGRGLWEFRPSAATPEKEIAELEPGAELGVAQFFAGQSVDVRGISKGKGFAGTIKRWNFHSQDATHGNSLAHRAGGSIGQCQTPGKVFKGKKMAGHMGAHRVTVQNLEVVAVDGKRNTLLISGAVPGANGSLVVVKPAVKAGLQQRPASDDSTSGES